MQYVGSGVHGLCEDTEKNRWKLMSFEIAGFIVSGISLLNELFQTHKDLTSWIEQDLEVDAEWLPLAISKGILEGSETQYAWAKSPSVATKELQGTHQIVIARNDEKKIKYRIVRGLHGDFPLVLMKSVPRVAAA